jgi:twitching motility protein
MMNKMDTHSYEIDVSKLDFRQRNRLDLYLNELIEKGGSDLHVKSGGVIRGRFNGEIIPMSNDVLAKEDALTLAKELLQFDFGEFLTHKNADFTYELNDDYRFRVNLFFQMDGISGVFRVIPKKIPTFADVKLPAVIEKITDSAHRGIILVTGPTGSGKTTTLASMINHMNETKRRHIITLENPIEFAYKDKKSVINQRSIGQDTLSFADGLRAALREDPDVILIGEMRDAETIETAMHAAETGHLVLSTLHTIDAKESIGRVINMFPKAEQDRVKMTLASVLYAVISQRLVKTVDNKRRAAVEVLIKNLRIKEIMEADDGSDDIYTAISESKNTYGMQTFEQHLLEFYEQGIITAEEALSKSGKPNDLEIKIKNVDLAKSRSENGGDAVIPESIISLKDLD